MVMESHAVCWRPNVRFRDSFWKAIYLNTFLITLWKIWYNPRSYSFPYCEYQQFMASGIGLSPCPRIWSGIYEPWWNWIILFRITTTIGRKRNPYSDPWHSSRNLGCVVQSFCFGIQLEHINILYTVWFIYMIGGLEHDFYYSIYWECHHPNWRTHIFQRARYTTNQMMIPMEF
jgi:hypothetical protein